MRRPAPRSRLLALAAAAVVVAACSGGPILASPPITYPSPPAETARPTRPPDPIAVELPRDDGPHDRLSEWWYYTGHLATTGGRRFGFEAVVFRAERGSVPAAWASHLALTDEQGRKFHYAQRSEVGPQVDHSPRNGGGEPTGFDLQVSGLNPDLIAQGAPALGDAWRIAGSAGVDTIEAGLTPEEATAAGAAFGLRLELRSTKPAALHDEDGFVDFGPAGSSYYYSRTRLAATGELELDGERLRVEGIAWFDHQWGDFVSVGGDGWDWFAINLDDGTDLTISVVFGQDGQGAGQSGTVVDPGGSVRYLRDSDVIIFAAGVWASQRTGRIYEMNWHIEIPSERLLINLVPTLEDQELDSRPTTGVIYWEGSHSVSAKRGEFPTLTTLGGEAYVEMTRYGD
jgi:predicted secreted hydrolase